jgi:two-component system response regulator (stage 0 sporulation protein F)
MNPITEKTPAVLIIDDEQINRSRLKELFLVLGLPTHTAVNADDGLKLYQKHHTEIELVFLDMLMPGINSDNVLKKLKQIDPKVKVICMSNNTKEIAQRIKQMGDVGVVEKPVTVDQVLKELNEII